MLPPDSTTECRRGVSVVVCCHNSASRIGPTIAHLARQHVHDEWEVIVVDNGSTDDTATVAERTWREHGSPAPLRILKEPRLGSAFARELGILQSRYEYILFCDDDNWLDPRYLQLAVEIMDDKPDIGALGGAAAGGLIGAAVGHPGAGAAIGGGLGLGAGALIGDQFQGHENTNYRQQRQIQSNQNQINRNRRDIERLRAQHGEY